MTVRNLGQQLYISLKLCQIFIKLISLFLDQIGQMRYPHDRKTEIYLMEVVLSKIIICCPSYAVRSAFKCEKYFLSLINLLAQPRKYNLN